MLTLHNGWDEQLSAVNTSFNKGIRMAAETILASERYWMAPTAITTFAAITWRWTPVSQWATNWMLSLTPISSDRNLQWRYMEQHKNPDPAMAESDEASSRYVSAVGEELIRALETRKIALPSLFWKFRAVRNTRFELWALPGGEIVVSDGLISVLDAHELAALIACAMGDVLNRHVRQMTIQSISGWNSVYLGSMGCSLGLAFPCWKNSCYAVILSAVSYWSVPAWGDGALQRKQDQFSVSFARRLLSDAGNEFSRYALDQAVDKLELQKTLNSGQGVAKSSPLARWISAANATVSDEANGDSRTDSKGDSSNHRPGTRTMQPRRSKFDAYALFRSFLRRSNPFGGAWRELWSNRRNAPKRYDEIPNGTVVTLQGLVVRKDRNGERGNIQGFDRALERYVVALQDSVERVSVKPDNLLLHAQVTLQGLDSRQSSLNGKQGTIIAWSKLKQRYYVSVRDVVKVVDVKPTEIILAKGTVVQILGLTTKPELNGTYGTVKSWVSDSNRYKVQLSENQIIRIKAENVGV